MSTLFCTVCGHRMTFDSPFCEECGTSAVQPPPISATAKTFANLYDFVKNHLAVVNIVVIFSTFVVGTFDFLVPAIKPILVLIYCFTGVLASLMLLAALFPKAWSKVIARTGIGSRNNRGDHEPLHERDAWRGTIILLTGITFGGIVSLAKAGQGGAIVNTFPALKEVQISLLSLNNKSDKIQSGVDRANDKLDRIADALDPANPADRCTDLQCALIEGASPKLIQKLWDKGNRFPEGKIRQAVLMEQVMHAKSPGRFDSLNFLLDHDFPADTKHFLSVSDESELPKTGTAFMSEAWKAANLSQNPTTKFTRLATGNSQLNNWNDMAGCIGRTTGGLIPIQVAALTGDRELFDFFVKRKIKIPTQPISCQWKVGFDMPRPGHPGEFSARALTGQVHIRIDEKDQPKLIPTP